MLNSKNKFLTVLSSLILFFLMAPLAIVIITAFGKEATISFPIKGFTLDWFGNVFAQPDFVSGFQMSLLVALIASILALLIGIPAVYALIRLGVPHQKWFQTLFLSPTFIPEIVIGFALYQGLMITVRLPLLLTLIIGHILLCLPYVIRLITASMVLLDKHIEEAAWIYGSSKLETFFKIMIPNIYPSIVAAFMLSFINSFNNIPITLFLNGPDLSMLPTAILNYLQNNYDPTVSAISVLLMLFTAVMMLVAEKFLGLKSIMK